MSNMSNLRKGGKPANKFILKHFKFETKTQSRRWMVRCKHCPADSKLIEHRDVRCLKHLIDVQACPNVPPVDRAEGQRNLMRKGGVNIADPNTDEEEDTSLVNSEHGSTFTTATEGSSVSKRAKISEAGVGTAMKRNLDSFLDRAMSEKELDRANLRLLRWNFKFLNFNKANLFSNHLDFSYTEIYRLHRLKVPIYSNGFIACAHLTHLQLDMF